MTTKAERDARLYWCDEHDRMFVGREGCPDKATRRQMRDEYRAEGIDLTELHRAIYGDA